MRQLLAQGDIPYAFHTDGNDSFVDDDRMIGMYTMEVRELIRPNIDI